MPETQRVLEKVIAKKVSASRDVLLNCTASEWAALKGLRIEMGSTPLANQPSPYIKGTFDETKIGAVKELLVKAAHNGKEIFFYFEWKSPMPNLEIEDIGTFPDAVAPLFPFKDTEKTPIKEMGSQDYPTNAWYWRPDFKEKPKNQVSRGLSTSLYTKESSLASHSKYENGTWRVVIARGLKVTEDSVAFVPGGKSSVGFAAWEGANGERGGVKSFSKEWRDLVLEA
jgi:DMSO reductase family type II enzyme heme b subunit